MKKSKSWHLSAAVPNTREDGQETLQATFEVISW
jgi:hypothetical protein